MKKEKKETFGEKLVKLSLEVNRKNEEEICKKMEEIKYSKFVQNVIEMVKKESAKAAQEGAFSCWINTISPLSMAESRVVQGELIREGFGLCEFNDDASAYISWELK